MPLARANETLTREEVCDLLSYDADTGFLIWKFRPNARKEWNTRNAGNTAGTPTKPSGYIQIAIHGKLFLAHRVIWLMVAGEWPDEDVDHIDCNPSNNGWTNLRRATFSENRMNTRRRSDNVSGYKGVHWNKRRRNWTAEVWRDYKKIHLGAFSTAEAAHKAYCEAAIRLHGEFARLE